MKTHKLIIRLFAYAALIVCGTACSDDWDNHYDDGAGVDGSATKTLWEQITSRPDLQDFAKICEQTKFYTSETNKPGDYYFKDVLNDITLTVFAPVDGSYDADSVLQLIEDGNSYVVQTQFLANHIRRNRMDVVGEGVSDIIALNSKNNAVDMSEKTYNGRKMVDINIPATNGVLHTIEGPIQFLPNLHEYLRQIQGRNALAKMIVLNDSSYFNQYASIEGEPDEDGNIHYIDSVFVTTNQLFYKSFKYNSPSYLTSVYFSGLGASYGLDKGLAEEDSAYALIIPSDQAYNNWVQRIKGYYRYAPGYANNAGIDQATSNETRDDDYYTTKVVPIAMKEDDPGLADALEDYAEKLAISQVMRPLLINMNSQFHAPKGTRSEVIAMFDQWKDGGYDAGRGEFVDSIGFLTCYSDTLRKLPYRPYYLLQRPDRGNGLGYGFPNVPSNPAWEWDKLGCSWTNGISYDPHTLFDGATPIKVSNGLVYEVDNLNIPAATFLHNDIVVLASKYSLYEYANEDNPAYKATSESCPHDTIMMERGYIDGSFLTMNPSNRTKYSFAIYLGTPLSATYDIYAVVVPEYYNTRNFKECSFSATLCYVGEESTSTKKEQETTSSTEWSDRCNARGIFTPDSSKVDTVLLFKNFRFPYCYSGVSGAYPTLRFDMSAYTPGNQKTVTNNICLSKIVLVAKQEENQN